MRLFEVASNDEIERLLLGNFIMPGSFEIVNGFVNVYGDCKVRTSIPGGYTGKLPINFGIVTGTFKINDCNLKTLDGCPREIGIDFIAHRNSITSLEGGPKIVGRSYFCRNDIVSLNGLPDSVGGRLVIGYSPTLPLLRLVNIKNLNEVYLRSSDINTEVIEDIVNAYINRGGGDGMALMMAAELTRAGFKGNAGK